MITSNGGQRWIPLAILALAAGPVAAADVEQSRQLEMEVVEVVEKSMPALVSKDDYFAPLAADLNDSLGEELRRNLEVSAMTGYQLLAAELELSNGTRVVANDTDVTDSSDTEAGRTSGT